MGGGYVAVAQQKKHANILVYFDIYCYI
jgi:hypothetical protein